MPAGADVTVPVPVPLLATIKVWFSAKLATTSVAAVTVIEHAAVPLHAPLQPVNTEPGDGVAVSTSDAPDGRLVVHVPGQSRSDATTRPLPLPPSATVTGKVGR